MSDAPKGANGSPSLLLDAGGRLSPRHAAVPDPLAAAVAGALPASTFTASGLELPRGALPPFPYLEAVMARHLVAEGQRTGQKLTTFLVELRLRASLAQGKAFAIGLPVGMPGAEVAKLLRQTADALDALVADCAPQPDERQAPANDSGS